MAQLEISVGGKRRVVPLTQPIHRIGRQGDNDIIIDDNQASRRHCVLERKAEGVTLRDLESRNGTWVGENRIAEAHLLDGDSFRIGATTFRVSGIAPQPAPQPKPAAPRPAAAKPAAAKAALPGPGGKAGAAAGGGKPQRVHVSPAPESSDEDGVVIDASVVEIPAPAEPVQGGSGVLAPVRLGPRDGSIGTGPIARQLDPLIEAARGRPTDRGLPSFPRELRLLDRQSKPLKTIAGEEGRPAEAVAALQQLLFASIRVRATDIHMEPKEATYGLRVRIDGMLQQLGELTKPLSIAMLNVIKVLCQADIAKKNVVQEGSFAAALIDRRVDFRVSLTPIPLGQKLALRILDKATVPTEFSDLGMDEVLVVEARKLLSQDAGMVLVSGPTGSGKTTTLYSALQGIDAKRRNVVTIEDPIEYRLEHATQIAIDPVHGVTFASVLSSILRQDPDVVFVGEMRDKETADLAMQAASTGHLVLSTVHARDTIGTIFRLLDLGVEPFQIANSMSMAISQRLVRLLCTHCKRPFRPEARMVRDLRLDERQSVELYAPVGCVRCMHTGFLGRMAIFEVMRFTPALRDVIITKPTIGDIRKAAGDWLFRTLADSGRRKVLEGLTSFEEAERVASGD